MSIIIENLTLEDLCDLMYGSPESEEDETWVVEAEISEVIVVQE